MPHDIAEIDQNEFFAALQVEDELGLVIRATIYVENQLIRLIEGTVESVPAINRLNLDYDGRVNLAVALGLRETLKPPLSALGNIRNRFAHQLEAVLGESEVKNLYSSFAQEDKQVIQGIYAKLRRNFDRPKKMSSLKPADRFRLYAVTLRGALIVGRAQSLEIRS